MKILFSLGFLLGLVSLAEPQQRTFEEITRNNCGEDQDLPENLSCALSLARLGGTCLMSSQLCDGTADCSLEEDEGISDSLNDLECNFQGKEVLLLHHNIVSN